MLIQNSARRDAILVCLSVDLVKEQDQCANTMTKRKAEHAVGTILYTFSTKSLRSRMSWKMLLAKI